MKFTNKRNKRKWNGKLRQFGWFIEKQKAKKIGIVKVT